MLTNEVTVPFTITNTNDVHTNHQRRAPSKAHWQDVGYDLVADEDVTLYPDYPPTVVGTGIRINLPAGMAGLILPRSGLAANFGVTVVNSPGLIDPGYTGEIKVALINLHSSRTHQVSKGDRIAQLILIPFLWPQWEYEYPDLFEEYAKNSPRGSSGFGSSDK